MENKFYMDPLERFLKEKSDEFKMYPSRRVWHSIYNNLHPARKWPSVAVLLALFYSLILIGYINSGTTKMVKPVDLSVSGIQKLPGELPVQNSNFPNLSQTSAFDIASVISTGEKVQLLNYPANTHAPYTVPVSNPAELLIPGLNNLVVSPSALWNEFQNPLAATANNMMAFQPGQAANTIPLIPPPDNVSIPVSENENAIPNKPAGDQITGIPGNALLKTEKATSDPKKSLPAVPANSNSSSITANLSREDLAWVEDYALQNKSSKKRWQQESGFEMYVTPSVGYRTLKPNSDIFINTSLFTQSGSGININKDLHQHPAISVEAGAALIHRFAKNLRWKAGLQLNYTSYLIKAYDLGHPVLTTLQMRDINSGYPTLESVLTNYTSSKTGRQVNFNNNTVQLSLPLGLDVRLAGKDNIQWFAGATIQGSYIVSGKSALISSDRNYYVQNNTLIKKWNMNTAVETFITYKTNSGITVKAGPQFRYQPLSTYSKRYSVTEKTYSIGIKMGIIKDF
jgi:hypothetical protein